MGDIIDFEEQRERRNPVAIQRDGVFIGTSSPFVVITHYEDGVMRNECRLLSERMLRDLLDGLP